MYNKESKKKHQGKGRLMDSKKYKSMTKEEIIRKIVEKEEELKKHRRGIIRQQEIGSRKR